MLKLNMPHTSSRIDVNKLISVVGTQEEIDRMNDIFVNERDIDKIKEESHERKFTEDSLTKQKIIYSIKVFAKSKGKNKKKQIFMKPIYLHYNDSIVQPIVFNRGLTSDEVRILYNQNKPPCDKNKKLLWYLKNYKLFNKMQRKIFMFIVNIPTKVPPKCMIGDTNVAIEHIKSIPFILQYFHGVIDDHDKLIKEYCIGGDGFHNKIPIHQFLCMMMSNAPLHAVQKLKEEKKNHIIRERRDGDPECDIVFKCKKLIKDVKKLKKKYWL